MLALNALFCQHFKPAEFGKLKLRFHSRMTIAASRPKAERKSFSKSSYDDGSSDSSSDQVNFSTPISISPPVSRPPANPPSQKPQARALYDFDKGWFLIRNFSLRSST